MTITSSPVTPIRPIGSDVTLTCTVELSPTVNVPVTVNVQLTDPAGNPVTTSTSPLNGSTYITTVTAMVSSFGRSDSGVYTCTATVTSSNTLLSASSSRSDIVTATIGKTKFIQTLMLYRKALLLMYYRCLSIP